MHVAFFGLKNQEGNTICIVINIWSIDYDYFYKDAN